MLLRFLLSFLTMAYNQSVCPIQAKSTKKIFLYELENDFFFQFAKTSAYTNFNRFLLFYWLLLLLIHLKKISGRPAVQQLPSLR